MDQELATVMGMAKEQALAQATEKDPGLAMGQAQGKDRVLATVMDRAQGQGLALALARAMDLGMEQALEPAKAKAFRHRGMAARLANQVHRALQAQFLPEAEAVVQGWGSMHHLLRHRIRLKRLHLAPNHSTALNG